MSTQSQDSAAELAQRLRQESDKALRAEKNVSDEHPDMEHVDEEPRTAVRFVGTEATVDQFQVVTTKVRNFPLGSDMVGVHSLDTVIEWIRDNDPEIVAVEDVDGWEQTDYATDHLEDDG